jgi:hypothetical protein
MIEKEIINFIFYPKQLMIEQFDNELNECCQSNDTKTNYCFKWKSNFFDKQHYGCLPARFSTENDKLPCKTNQDCNGGILDSKRMKNVCIHPVWDNFTRLIRIEHSMGDSILYVGSTKELIYSGIC